MRKRLNQRVDFAGNTAHNAKEDETNARDSAENAALDAEETETNAGTSRETPHTMRKRTKPTRGDFAGNASPDAEEDENS